MQSHIYLNMIDISKLVYKYINNKFLQIIIFKIYIMKFNYKYIKDLTGNIKNKTIYFTITSSYKIHYFISKLDILVIDY